VNAGFTTTVVDEGAVEFADDDTFGAEAINIDDDFEETVAIGLDE
jgi:hypothetical protein